MCIRDSFGIVFLSHQIGSFIGAFFGGVLVDLTGTYTIMWWVSVALGLFAMAMHLLIDDGPLPDNPPPASRGLRLAPAALVLLFVTGAATSVSAAVDIEPVHAADGSSDGPAPIMSYCALGATVAR